MPQVRAWFYRLLGLFLKNRREAEMAGEMQEHLDRLIERNVAAGISPNDARNAALREFGGVEQIKEMAREQRVWRWADDFLQDVRFGGRMLLRTPGFTTLAILCLTLAIGANAAVFSWIEGMLIRPYPLVAHQERMFALGGTMAGTSEYSPMSYPEFIDLEKNSTLFESFIVDRITGTTLSLGDRAERWVGGIVSANYFDALGVHPILGRGFRPELPAGRSQRALGRRLCLSQTRSNSSTSTGRVRLDRAKVGNGLSGFKSRPRVWALAVMENAVQRYQRSRADAGDYNCSGLFRSLDRLRKRQQSFARPLTSSTS